MNNTVVNILKKAILLEMRAKSFYEKMASSTDIEDLSAVFSMMAVEEASHINELSRQLSAYAERGAFLPIDPQKDSEYSDTVLDKTVQDKIDAAGFEASAISAAIALEENAIQFYSGMVEKSTTEEEKKLFTWLAAWEKGHLLTLTEIDKQLKDNIWDDDSFWT